MDFPMYVGFCVYSPIEAFNIESNIYRLAEIPRDMIGITVVWLE